MSELEGLHHVTAIAGDPQRNLDFYTGVLGLRLVKLTVNFDDPTTYHLYYGNATASPGSILTFFPWPNVKRGRRGTGQVTSFSLTIPPGSLGFWSKRLFANGASLEESQKFGERVLVFTDPDNLLVELVEAEIPMEDEPWTVAGIPRDAAIRALHSVALTEADPGFTATFLRDVLGFREQESSGIRTRFRTGGSNPGYVDVVVNPSLQPGVIAGGSVHHVAFRTPDPAQQENWRSRLARAGVGVTPVRDRRYFHSIYFVEPGTVLLEIATDGPGFDVDEPADRLGHSLQLPPWLAHAQAQIEARLPRLRLPHEEAQPAPS